MSLQLEFDSEFARNLVGKHVLVGITERDGKTDAVIRHLQMHGVVVSADQERGIVVRNPNTKTDFTLPPVTNRFEQAGPGEYHLKSTGEVVVNPDFVCTWTRYPKAK